MCFFFSSRRRHTRFDCDWSSDVCSSDLAVAACWKPSSLVGVPGKAAVNLDTRSEEHTSELQSQSNLVCRLLLEKKKEYASGSACCGCHRGVSCPLASSACLSAYHGPRSH